MSHTLHSWRRRGGGALKARTANSLERSMGKHRFPKLSFNGVKRRKTNNVMPTLIINLNQQCKREEGLWSASGSASQRENLITRYLMVKIKHLEILKKKLQYQVVSERNNVFFHGGACAKVLRVCAPLSASPRHLHTAAVSGFWKVSMWGSGCFWSPAADRAAEQRSSVTDTQLTCCPYRVTGPKLWTPKKEVVRTSVLWASCHPVPVCL